MHVLYKLCVLHRIDESQEIFDIDDIVAVLFMVSMIVNCAHSALVSPLKCTVL
jgi:hypothetical protein